MGIESLKCPACETEWEPGLKFCPGCAQPVADLLAAARRAAEPPPDEAPTGKLDEENAHPAEPAQAPAPTPGPAPRADAGLAFPWGAQAIALHESLIVGREHPPLAAQLSSYPGVGRAHARFDHRDEGLHVTDLESTNGTTVDGRRLPANLPEPLRSGQVVGFGVTLKATVL